MDVTDHFSLGGNIQSGFTLKAGEYKQKDPDNIGGKIQVYKYGLDKDGNGNPVVSLTNDDGRQAWINLTGDYHEDNYGGYFELLAGWQQGVSFSTARVWAQFLDGKLRLDVGKDVGGPDSVEFGPGGDHGIKFTIKPIDNLQIGLLLDGTHNGTTLANWLQETSLGVKYEVAHVWAASVGLRLDSEADDSGNGFLIPGVYDADGNFTYTPTLPSNEDIEIGGAFRYWLGYSAPRDTSLVTLTAGFKVKKLGDTSINKAQSAPETGVEARAWENVSFNQFLPDNIDAWVNLNEGVADVLADEIAFDVNVELGGEYRYQLTDNVKVSAAASTALKIAEDADVLQNIQLTLPKFNITVGDHAGIEAYYKLQINDGGTSLVTHKVYAGFGWSF